MEWPNCSQMKEILPSWAGGDLDQAVQAAAWRHLSTCPSCRLEASRWHELRAVLAAAVPKAGHDSFFSELSETILVQVEQETAVAPVQGARRSLRLQSPVLAAAAAAILLAGWLYSYRASTLPQSSLLGDAPLALGSPDRDPTGTVPVPTPRGVPLVGLDALQRLALRKHEDGGTGSVIPASDGRWQGLRGRATAVSNLARAGVPFEDLPAPPVRASEGR